MSDPVTRRAFLVLAPGGILALLGALRPPPAAATRQRAWKHPDPRPGIDGSRVLTVDDLADAPHVVELFDEIRKIPHVVDGIRCHCGCADLPGYRSLLSCYESPGMARWCEICQGGGRIAVNRTREGQTLDQIRRAIDARYGPPA